MAVYQRRESCGEFQFKLSPREKLYGGARQANASITRHCWVSARRHRRQDIPFSAFQLVVDPSWSLTVSHWYSVARAYVTRIHWIGQP